jgi:putative membrane protein
MNTSIQHKEKDKIFLPIIGVLSIAIPLVVAILMYMPNGIFGNTTIDVSRLPMFHAILNGSTAAFLILGITFIKNNNKTLHKASMLSAFGLSSVFLVSYVIYHSIAPQSTFGGEGLIRPIYFFILISHIILATTIVPFALLSTYRGITEQYSKHKKISRWTFPIWLYVSITGVAVYLFMQPYY